MSFMGRALGINASLQNPNTPLTAAQIIEYLGLGDTDSGLNINERQALRSTVVLACVRVIAESLASLPFNIYQQMNPGKRKASEHRLYSVLHDEPNPQMTSLVFREALQCQLLLWGNAYAEIQRDRAGRAVALWPLPSDRTRPVRSNSKLVYETNVQSNMDAYLFQVGTEPATSGTVRYLDPSDVLHVPGLSFNGLVGMSPIQLAKQTIGLSAAAEKFGALFFGNGSRPSGILSHPGTLKPEARENIRKSFQDATTRNNALKAIVLEEGVTFSPLSIPPNDAQFIETRKFQISEIARIFRVPLHLVQDLERATNNNIEQQGLEFVMHTLRPWAVRWEQEVNRKLLPGGTFFSEFSMEGLLRGDFKSRMEGYAVMRNVGVYSSNDIRSLENMNPIPEEEGGDIYLAPLNMVPLALLAQQEELGEGPGDPDEGSDTGEDTGNPGDPSNAMRDRVVYAFKRLFTDAVRRVLAREKRDAKGVRSIFSPVLTAMAETLLGFSFAKPKLNSDAAVFISDYAGGVAVRAEKWEQKEQVQITDAELQRAYKALNERIGDLQEA